jgi:hypothetical protein
MRLAVYGEVNLLIVGFVKNYLFFSCGSTIALIGVHLEE